MTDRTDPPADMTDVPVPPGGSNQRRGHKGLWLVVGICSFALVLLFAVVILVGFSAEGNCHGEGYEDFCTQVTAWHPGTVGSQEITGTLENNSGDPCASVELDIQAYVAHGQFADPVGDPISVLAGSSSPGETITWHWSGTIDPTANDLEEDQPEICDPVPSTEP